MSTKTTKTECSRKNTTASRYFVPNKRKLTRGGPAGVGGPHLLQVDDDPGAALLNVLKGKVKLLRAVALHGSQNLGSEASIMHTDGHLHIVWGHSQHGTVTSSTKVLRDLPTDRPLVWHKIPQVCIAEKRLTSSIPSTSPWTMARGSVGEPFTCENETSI
eukprot:1030893-Prorocentrum_minimum.AAC.2